MGSMGDELCIREISLYARRSMRSRGEGGGKGEGFRKSPEIVPFSKHQNRHNRFTEDTEDLLF